MDGQDLEQPSIFLFEYSYKNIYPKAKFILCTVRVCFYSSLVTSINVGRLVEVLPS